MNELRDALIDIGMEANCASFAPEKYDLVGTLRLMADKCEAALEAPSEMQQLVEWIDGMIDVDLSGDSAQQYGAHLVREHIRTEFLGEEGADE